MDVFVQGKGKVTLNQGDFLAQGGQGAVYFKRDIAYKIYLDPTKMIPVAKIQELAALTLPCIIRPCDLLLDNNNLPIGYTMPHIPHAVPLCQLFARAFRDRNHLTPDSILALVRKLQEGVAHVHSKGVLIVDLNEMNFLVDQDFKQILFIDVDSYQTPGFKATAIMDSIRDRHCAQNQFSQETDWFSFGILSFQMFIGIHPYKGKHPTVTDLDTRMQSNLSVLNKSVSLPQVCYPFDVIPQGYLRWYHALFEQSVRCAPPTDLNAPLYLSPTIHRLSGTEKLDIRMLGVFEAPLVLPLPNAGPQSAVTTQGLFLRGKQILPDSSLCILSTLRMNRLLAAGLRDGNVFLHDIMTNRPLEVAFVAEAMMTYQDRLYIKQGTGLFEMEFVESGNTLFPSLRAVGNALANATHVYDGLAVQNVLGACYVTVFPRPRTTFSVRIRELDRYRILDARFDNNVLMLVGILDGRYDRFVLRFDPDYQTYDLRQVADISYAGLNFITLENGICIHLNENEELEIFTNRMDSPGLKLLTDDAIKGVRLFKNGMQVLFTRDNTLYSMSLK